MMHSIATTALAALFLITAVSAGAAAPPAPSVNVSNSGQAVTLNWNAVQGATGYTLYYAPYPNVDYIGSGDMGTNTGFSTVLPPGAAYFVAVRARNSDGESPYSNIGTVFVPSGGTFVLNPGDYWEFEWLNRSTSASAAGTSRSETKGKFRLTLGAAQIVGNRIAFPISITGDNSIGPPVWSYLSADGPALLGTIDGTVYSTIFRGDDPRFKGVGFFRFFPPGVTNSATLVNVKGTHITTSAWALSRSRSTGGCTFFPEVGQTICDRDSSTFTETEYYKIGVGPIGYRYNSSASFSGGGFFSAHTNLRTIELVKSSRVADDGTYFAGSP